MLNWFLMLLTVLFLGLKLTGFITWSYWAVFAPLIGMAVISLVNLAAMFFAIQKSSYDLIYR